MNAWRQLAVPAFCERMIGFSVPHDRAILAISYEAMHLIHLTSPITVDTDRAHCEYDLYNPDTGQAQYLGLTWNIIGLFAGSPQLHGRDGEELILDTKEESLAVAKGSKILWSYSYSNFSGDWAAATFSPDGRFIVLGCPYDFDFRVFERSDRDAAGDDRRLR